MMGPLPTHSKSLKIIPMRKLTATLCLTFAVLLGSEVRGSDLPVCEESPLLGKSGNTNNPYLLLWNNCVGIYDPFTGSVYAGEWKSGRRHGPGITKFFNGRVQQGIWSNGVLRRQGKVNLHAHIKEYIFPKGSRKKLPKKTYHLHRVMLKKRTRDFANALQN